MDVFFDHRKWQKVIYNLVSNAIKFTDGGGGVFVRFAEIGDHVELQVSDTGIGIVESKLPTGSTKKKPTYACIRGRE